MAEHQSTDDPLVVVDLFAGAGGLSTGVVEGLIDRYADVIADQTGLERDELTMDHPHIQAWLGANVELHAINPDEDAIATHEQNHPWAEHYHAKIEELHPPDVVEPGSVTLLTGGPSCTHYSKARGGKPVSEQKRASGWHVLHWVEMIRPEHILLENVPEFRDWGPIVDGQPTRDGSIFQRWVGMLEALGYSVLFDDEDDDYGTVLNAADFGEAQSRDRLFITGSKSKRPTIPEPTHSDTDPEKPDRRTAADIIDWSDPGTSLWTRDLEHARVQPLAKSTMGRIAEGIRRHCDDRLEPLADVLETIGKDELKALRETVVPIEHAALVADAVDTPFLVRSPGGSMGLTEPNAFCLRQQSGGVPPSVDSSLPTISKRGAISMATTETRPLVKPRNGPYRGNHSNPLYPPESRPLHTVTAKNHDGHLVEPSLIHYSHGGALRSVDRPAPTVATERGGAFALSNPMMVEYYGNAESARATDEPLGTVTKKDRFALCVPALWPWGLDVRYRMLKPEELKQAQGFPESYELSGGTKQAVTAQIGNAVPVHLAKAVSSHLLADNTPSLSTFGGGLAHDPDAEVPAYAEVISDD